MKSAKNYKIIFSQGFDKRYKKLIRHNKALHSNSIEAIKQLSRDPFHLSLKTHRVNTRQFGKKWSSYVDGDIRIIWSFSSLSKDSINLYYIGGHSGSKKVYI